MSTGSKSARLPNPVLEHIDEICASKTFVNAEKTVALLRYLGSQYVQGHTPKETTIAIDVFGLPPDYDPTSNPRVRIAVARLRRRLAEYYTENPHSPMQIEIPIGRYTLEVSHLTQKSPAPTPAPPPSPPPAQPEPPASTRKPILTRRALLVSASAALLLAAAGAAAIYLPRILRTNETILPNNIQTVEAWTVRPPLTGDKIAVALRDRVRIARLSGGTQAEFTHPGPVFDSLQWTPDGKGLIWTGRDNQYAIASWLFDSSGLKQVHLIDGLRRPALSPDGKWWAGYDPEGRFVVVRSISNSDRQRIVALINPAESFETLEWTPDSKALIWSVTENGYGCRLQHTGLNGDFAVVHRVEGYCSVRGITSSRDILFLHNNRFTRESATYSARLSEDWKSLETAPQLIYKEDSALRPYWMNDGRQVLITNGVINKEINLVQFGDGVPVSQQRLTNDPREKFPVRAALDGSGIFYEMETRPGVRHVFFQKTDGSAPLQWTDGDRSGLNPVQTPDAKWLLYVRRQLRRPGSSDMPEAGGIFRKRADLSYPRPLGLPERQIFAASPFSKIDCGTDPGSICAFDRIEGNSIVVRRLDLETGPAEPIARLGLEAAQQRALAADRALYRDLWSISPDGQEIAVVPQAAPGDTILIYSTQGPAEPKSIKVPDLRGIEALSWRKLPGGGAELFLSVASKGAMTLYRYRPGSQPIWMHRVSNTPMLQTPIWAESPPSGAWVALPERWPGIMNLRLINR